MSGNKISFFDEKCSYLCFCISLGHGLLNRDRRTTKYAKKFWQSYLKNLLSEKKKNSSKPFQAAQPAFLVILHFTATCPLSIPDKIIKSLQTTDLIDFIFSILIIEI